MATLRPWEILCCVLCTMCGTYSEGQLHESSFFLGFFLVTWMTSLGFYVAEMINKQFALTAIDRYHLLFLKESLQENESRKLTASRWATLPHGAKSCYQLHEGSVWKRKISPDIFGKPKMQFPSHNKSYEHSEHHSLLTIQITQVSEKFKWNRKKCIIL